MSIKTGENQNKLGKTIRKFRFMKNMPAKELADRVGIATSNLSSIESGDRLPKIDTCCKIATELKVDPVEICGIELTEIDEKRLLMKLLTKYADNIEVVGAEDEKGNECYDSRGKSVVTLPIDFVDFARRYNKHIEEVNFAVESIAETDPRYELVKANAEDKFIFWLDTYPEYDAFENARKVSDSLDYEKIDKWSESLQGAYISEFYPFQSEYVIPRRNDAWKAKYSKKFE